MNDRRMPQPRTPFTDAFKQERDEKPPHTGEKLGPAKTGQQPGQKPGPGPLPEEGIESPI